MWQHWQRIIKEEAEKYGYGQKPLNEAPALGGGEASPTMFGWSKHQFESKFRELMKKMGYERGIVHMASVRDANHEMMKIYFSNTPKAKDFVIAFNGMIRRASKGAVASVATEFNKMKVPTGTAAIVTLDLDMLKSESFAASGESLFEWFEEGIVLSEGGVKAALEDFMYDLPKAAIAELKPLMKQKKGGVAQQVMRLASITAILNKYGVKKELMGFNTAKLVNDYFDTFHGESVEVEGEQLSLAEGYEKVIMSHLQDAGFKRGDAWFENGVLYVSKKNLVARAMTALKKKKDIIELPKIEVDEEVDSAAGEQLSEQQQVIGKYRFTSFTEGSISGWMVSVQGIGEVGFIKAPAKKNTKTSIAPHQLYKTKGQSEGDPKLVMAAFPDSSTRFVNDKEIRFAPRQLLKAVAMWMDKHGKVMTEGTQFVEDGEIEEAKEKYLTGPGKKDPKRIIGIYSSTGKWIKDMGSEAEARKFVNKSWGESVEEAQDFLLELSADDPDIEKADRDLRAREMSQISQFIRNMPKNAVRELRKHCHVHGSSYSGAYTRPANKLKAINSILKKYGIPQEVVLDPKFPRIKDRVDTLVYDHLDMMRPATFRVMGGAETMIRNDIANGAVSMSGSNWQSVFDEPNHAHSKGDFIVLTKNYKNKYSPRDTISVDWKTEEMLARELRRLPNAKMPEIKLGAKTTWSAPSSVGGGGEMTIIAIKEQVEISEAKIAFKKILKGIDDAQGPFTVVVMRADAPGAMMQEKVKIAAALPAYINHMVTFSLTGKKWKAIVIENSKGQVVNVLRPTDIKEEVEVNEAVDGPWENASIVGIKSQRVAGWKTELKTARGHGGAPHGHQVYFLYHDGKGNFTVYHGDSLGKVVPAASAKKPVGVFKSKEDAMAGAKKDAASLHREEVEVNEAWWNSETLSKKDADSLLDDLESAYKKGGLRGTFKVPNGDSGPVWEMIDGLRDFLRGEPKNMIAYVLKGVKDFLSPTDRNDSRIKKVFESFTEDGEAISESVSATKEYRQQKIQSNRRLIVKLGTAAQGVKDTEARREMTQTLSSADTYNRRLGTPEMMKSGPVYWMNFEGIYVGRELERVRGLLIHHGIVVPNS